MFKILGEIIKIKTVLHFAFNRHEFKVRFLKI